MRGGLQTYWQTKGIEQLYAIADSSCRHIEILISGRDAVWR